MTPQERDLITTLLTRLKNATSAGQQQDAEADALIHQSLADLPDAPYYLVQTVLIQDLSLHQAQHRIAELEQQLNNANAQRPAAASFLGNLFGHRDPVPLPAPVPPPGPWSRGPQVASVPPAGPGYGQQGYAQQGYAQPGYAPGGGMMGGLGAGGGGFLRSAAATAAGVAGGALLFEGISSLFGHGYASGLGGGGGFAPGLGESVVNNYYGDGGGDYGGGGDYSGGGDAGGTPDAGGDYGGGGDYSGGGDAGGGGDFDGGGGGGDFGGGGDTSC